MKRRDVAVADIPGAFLTADMDEIVRMCLRGRLAELMVKAAPDIYSKYVTIENGVTVLYVTLQKALYGTLKAALLFYTRLVKDLTDYGFEINPYDPCVANKVVNGKQLTIVWHVDDLKISHVDADEVTKVIDWLKGIYGDNMRVSRGKVHDYLGMILDFSQKGECRVTMIDYIKQILEEFPEEVTETPSSPAACAPVRGTRGRGEVEREAGTIFPPRGGAASLPLGQGEEGPTDRDGVPDWQGKGPDKDDWGKLRRVLGYAKATLYMPLILRADSLTIIKWWVDASFAVHGDCAGTRERR